MPLRRETFSLVLGLLLAVGLLAFLPLDSRKVALLRWESQINSALNLRSQIIPHCTSLQPVTGTAAEKRFVESMAVPQREPATPCRVKVVEAQNERFSLREYWHFAVEILGTEGTPVVSTTHFKVEFPRPLALLPLLLVLVALLLEWKPFGIGSISFLYLTTLSGGNPLRALDTAWKSAAVALHTDKSFVGLSLLAIFLALYRSRQAHAALARTAVTPVERRVGRWAATLIGLWSPAFFTLSAPLLSPWSRRFGRIRHFFDYQTVILCISVYFLAFNPRSPFEFFAKNLMLPRYFSFAAFFYLMLSRLPGEQPIERYVLWKLPRFYRHLSAVFAFEAISFFVPELRALPTLTRVGVALFLSEALTFLPFDKDYFSAQARGTLGAIFMASFLAAVSVETGVLDLALVLCEPRIHPSALMIFIFFAGNAIGFATGSFSTTLFALSPLLTKYSSNPLVAAALVDGIVSGVLLSPFSVLNLLPSAHYGVRLLHIIGIRFRQLFVPLLIGCLIYTVSAVQAVAILRPVTFVFLCLVVLALRLRSRGYQIETATP